MTFLKQAIEQLEIKRDYETIVKYSGRFGPYGANIIIRSDLVTLNLSKTWKQISDEIKMGLAQELLVGLLKLKKNTMNMDLYNSFVKKIHIAIPKKTPEQNLLESFNRVNEKYFFGLMDIPNIIWGNFATSKLGSYDYRTDRITMSKVLEKNETFLDLVMHHELLHKKHKFKSKNGRSLYHSSAFKKDEKLFEDYEETEKQLKNYLKRTNLLRLFGMY